MTISKNASALHACLIEGIPVELIQGLQHSKPWPVSMRYQLNIERDDLESKDHGIEALSWWISVWLSGKDHVRFCLDLNAEDSVRALIKSSSHFTGPLILKYDAGVYYVKSNLEMKEAFQ